MINKRIFIVSITALSLMMVGSFFVFNNHVDTTQLPNSTEASHSAHLSASSKPVSREINSSASDDSIASNISNTSTQKSNHSFQIDPKVKQALKEMIRTDIKGLTQVQHNNGMVTMNLEGRFQHVPVAVIGDDGKVHIQEYSSPPE